MHSNSRGFTLVELLIVMLISSFMVAGIIATYKTQNKTHDDQERIVEAQQNLRAVMTFLESEIRAAGLDSVLVAGATIVAAAPDLIYVTKDINLDGDLLDANEHVAFDHYTPAGDVISVGLTRQNQSIAIDEVTAGQHYEVNDAATRPLARNIDGLAFAYAFDGDKDGLLDTDAGNNIIWAVDTDNDGDLDTRVSLAGPPHPALATQVDLAQIRAVRVWLLARASIPTKNYYDRNTYQLGIRQYTPADQFERRLLTAEIQCRNMGLGNGI